MYRVTATYIPRLKKGTISAKTAITNFQEFYFKVDAGSAIEAVKIVQNSGFFCGRVKQSFGFLVEVVK